VVSPTAGSSGRGSGGAAEEWSDGSGSEDEGPVEPELNLPGRVLYDFDGELYTLSPGTCDSTVYIHS